MQSRRHRRFLRAVVTLACGAAVLTACGGGGGDAAGGELVVYSGREKELVAPLLDEFAAETGIDVKVRYGGSAALAAQLVEEGDRSPADVFFAQDAGALGEVGGAGLLRGLDQTALDVAPPQLRADDGSWVGTSGRARVVVVNTETVAESDRPGSVFELTDPRWKDRVGIAPENASFQAFVSAVRQQAGDERARQWLEELKANGARDYPNNVTIVEAVAAGEIDAGLVNHYYLPKLEAEKGALAAENVFLPASDPGSLVNTAGVGILASSRNSDQARQFVDWLLAERAQDYFVTETYEYAVREGSPPPAGLPPLQQVQGADVDLSALGAALPGTVEMLKETGWLA